MMYLLVYLLNRQDLGHGIIPERMAQQELNWDLQGKRRKVIDNIKASRASFWHDSNNSRRLQTTKNIEFRVPRVQL